MPMFNGTGPRGLGAGTGRGLGPCGAGMRQGNNRGYRFGRGLGWRRAGGYGAPQPYQPSMTQEGEKEMLENEATDLERELKAIQERLKDIKK